MSARTVVTVGTALSEGDELVGGTYTATGEDESVLEASGTTTAAVTGSVLIKSDGDASSADESSFRGINAAVRVYDNATVTLTDVTVEASASNATGVFAYDGGTVNLDNCTVTLENCEVSGNDQSTKEGNVKANILLYQSMSGDASVGTSSFTMTGGSLTTESGAMIYCTNTDSVVTLTDVDLIYAQGDNGDGSMTGGTVLGVTL